MNHSDPFNKLLYQHEVLRARHEIREQYLANMGREVYENIGQVLSLVGIELGLLEYAKDNHHREKLSLIGDQVRQSVRDLRQMSSALHGNLEMLKEDGLIEALNKEINFYRRGSRELKVEISGSPRPIMASAGLILFRILQEIIVEILSKAELIGAAVAYAPDFIKFTSNYKGSIDWEAYSTNTRNVEDFILTLFQRINLIRGNFQCYQASDLENVELVVKI